MERRQLALPGSVPKVRRKEDTIDSGITEEVLEGKSLTVTGTRGFYTLGISFFNCKIIAKDTFLTLNLMLSCVFKLLTPSSSLSLTTPPGRQARRILIHPMKQKI